MSIKDWTRCAEALRQRRDGKTLAEIGADMGVSRERVRQLVMQGERREHALKSCDASLLSGLSARAKNCLIAENYSLTTGCTAPTPQEVREWLDSGRLQEIPGMGKKSAQEVAAWLATVSD